MSSPINHDENVDASLQYAPPWARRLSTPRTEIMAESSHGLPVQRESTGQEPSNFSGDRAIQELYRQLTLNPDKIPEPIFEESRSLWPMVLRLGAVVGVAASIAAAVVALPGAGKLVRKTTSLANEPALQQTANRVKVVRPDAQDLVQVANAADRASPTATDTGKSQISLLESAPPIASTVQQVAAPSLPAEHAPQASAPAPAAPQAIQTVKSEPTSSPPAHDQQQSASHPSADAPSQKPTPSSQSSLDPGEIATLIKRSQAFIQNGDLPSARILLQRAADAGSPDAALALGATYDPLAIRQLGVIGLQPDAARARAWYEKAAALGSAIASQKLADLSRAR
jgi:hypothetical protein